MNVDQRTWNVLSLCSGAGGLDLGYRLAIPNARTVCYVEIEAYCCEILASRMEDKALDEAPIWTDLKSFDGKPWRGVVDCITGGYPCQPFSIAGLRRGTQDPRHLWPYIAQIISDVRPRECFFENVSNHINIGFREVRSELESMGYRVAAGLFTAAEVGATHKRERLFILAVAHANNQRCDREHPLLHKRGSHADSFEAAGRSQDVADSNLSGFETRHGEPGASEPKQRQFGSGHLTLAYPPSPDDHAGWVRILAEHPELAPATSIEEEAKFSLRGMANGLVNRVDQLRAAGNGVVPSVAAKARRTLGRELGI